MLARPMSAPDKSVYIETFGCQMNHADTEVVLARLAEAGYSQTEDQDRADLVLYNTCAVRDHAEAKVRGRLGDLKRIKAERPGLRIGVMGCMAQREKEGILQRFPHVDLVVGTDQFVRMPQLLQQLSQQQHLVATDFGDFEDRAWTATRSQGVNAWVPVMRGCNYNCTYCVVPFTRGKEKSRHPQQIEDEVRKLVDEGFVQVTLLGQNVNAYQGALHEGGTADFAFLLEMVHEIPGIERIRYTTSHPNEFTERLIAAYARIPKLVSHLHLPVQSGSDRILMAMKRGYTALEFKSKVRKLRAARPDITLSSDFIVGFPGETEQDFEATMRLIDEVGFDVSYSFVYSARPGTPAAALADDTPPAVKSARLARLQKRIDELEADVSQAMLGTVQRVLVEGISKKSPNELAARTDNNRIVNFPGQLASSRGMVNVRITEVVRHTLRGELVLDNPLKASNHG